MGQDVRVKDVAAPVVPTVRFPARTVGDAQKAGIVLAETSPKAFFNIGWHGTGRVYQLPGRRLSPRIS